MIETLIGICQAIFVLCAAWWGYSYYSGRLQFSGEAEKRRLERVRKFGLVLIMAVILSAIGGSILLIIKIAEFSIIIIP